MDLIVRYARLRGRTGVEPGPAKPACVARTFPEYFDELEKLTLRAAPPT